RCGGSHVGFRRVPGWGTHAGHGWPASVAEVAGSGEDHRDSVLVAAVDAVLVAEGAAGVDDDLDAGLAGFLDGVAPGEREEGIAGEDGPGHFVAGLLHRDFDALHAVRLAAAHAEEAAVLRNGDGVALHVLYAAPGELQVFELRGRGLALGDDLEFDLLGGPVIGVLGKPAAANLAVRLAAGRVRLCFEDAEVLRLALQDRQSLRRVAGG